jgi:hypothetical protein
MGQRRKVAFQPGNVLRHRIEPASVTAQTYARRAELWAQGLVNQFESALRTLDDKARHVHIAGKIGWGNRVYAIKVDSTPGEAEGPCPIEPDGRAWDIATIHSN